MKNKIQMLSAANKYLRNTNAVIFIFTFICLLGFFFAIPGDIREYINGDYTPQVNSLFSGHYFLNDSNHLMDRHPPLTALVFFIVTKIAALLHLSQVYSYAFFIMVIVSLSNVMLYHITNVIGYRSISLITCLLFATCPFIGVLPLKLISEPMFIFFSYIAVYLLMKEYRSDSKRLIQYIKIGVALGLCMLSRPIALLYEFLIVAFIILAFRATLYNKFIFSLLIAVSSIAVISPWEYAMHVYNHKVLPLSSAGIYATRDGMSFNKKAYRHKLHLPADVDSLLQRFYKDYDHFLTADQVHQFLRDEFQKSPMTVVKLYFIKTLRFWYGVESQNPKYELFNKLLVSVYLLLCIIGLFVAFKIRGNLYGKLFFVLFILLNWATAVMFLPLLRYLVPAIGFLFIFSAFGLWKILHGFRLVKSLEPTPE
jgi:hypothetical protein